MALLMANPVADSTTISARWAPSTGQSGSRCRHANGSNIKNAPIHLTQDNVIGGTWPAT
jgi:hypothetical protein